MKDIYFMTVDLGTSFIKVGVYDTKSRCITMAVEPVKDERPAAGVFIQRGEELFEAVLRCMKKAAGQLGDDARLVEAMAFTGQMAGFMGVDSEWNDITTWSCSIDTRYVPYADQQMREMADSFLNICGTNAPQMCSKFEWFKSEFPEENKKIAKYVMISSYVIGKLSRMPIEEAPIDASFIAWSGMADIRKSEWSKELCEKIGMDPKHLPRIVNSDDICGTLCAEIAAQVGLKAGIPLISGAGDKVAGSVGAGVLDIGEMIFEAGSYGGFSCMVEEYRPDKEEHYYDGIVGSAKDKYYAHKYIPGSGITLDWFIERFECSEGRDKKQAFQEMEAKIAGIRPGSEGVMAIGLLGGSSMPYDGDLKGMWMGYSWVHGKEHLYHALLESFSYDLSLTVDRVSANYPEYDLNAIKLIGGGAKSTLWPQMMADVTGKRFERLDREDVALWGAAILAGSGIGVFSDISETARKYVGIRQTFKPDLEKHEVYKKYKELYRNYVKKMHKFYVGLAEIG